MSRWSRKTAQEKEATRKKIEQNERPKSKQWEGGLANEIYQRGFIPLMCPNCGWTFSNNYKIKDKAKDQMGFEATRCFGTCVNCDRLINRVLPSPFTEEGMMFAVVATNLVQKGSLSDDRNEHIQSKWYNKRTR